MTLGNAPIPTTLLSGFLGAGKTTLLQRILTDPRGVRYGVLVNDFGAVNIDAELIAATEGERISLTNGCVCCTIRDDLVEAVGRLLRSDPPPDRLLIEASGVSRPIAVVEALRDPALGGRIALDGLFCLVDAATFRDLDFSSTELAIEQAAAADVVLLNKCDLAPAEDIAAVEATLRGSLPALRLLPTRFAAVPRELLFGLGAGAAPRPDSSSQLHDHGHGHGHDHDHGHEHAEAFQAWSWQSEAPLDLAAFRAAVRRMPRGLLRAKGVLIFAERPEARGVFQLVGRRSTIEFVEGAAPRESALVAIARSGGFDPAALSRLLDGCVAADQRR
ncbi:MAG: CobW family GTP-binding protein [Kiloniellales bacterium]